MSERDAADRLIAEALEPDPVPEALDTDAIKKGKKAYWSYVPVRFAPDRDPWERQPRETTRAFAAFLLYRDMGPFGRSIGAVARAIGVGRTVPKRWHEQYRWEDRAGAWDDDQRKAVEGVRKDIQEKAIKDHANAAKGLIGLAISLLNKQRSDAGIDGRALQQAAIALDKGIHHHRLAIGLPTDVSRQDQYLKGLLEEAMQIQEQLRLILEEHLCDGCREKIGGEIRKIGAKQRRISDRASI